MAEETRKASINEPAQFSGLKNTYWILVASMTTAVISVFVFKAWPALAQIYFFRMLTKWIPSAQIIAKYSFNSSLAAAIYSVQWLFVFIYIPFMFAACLPWSEKLRRAVKKRNTVLPIRIKILVVCVAVIFIFYFLGDFNIIYFPTLFNGGAVPDPSMHFLDLGAIYTSEFALAVYSAFVPFFESIMFYFLIVVISNLKYYIVPAIPSH